MKLHRKIANLKGTYVKKYKKHTTNDEHRKTPERLTSRISESMEVLDMNRKVFVERRG